MPTLISVYDFPGANNVLYCLLEERREFQSINHKVLPSYTEHVEYVYSRPYIDWNLIMDDGGTAVGTVHLKPNREIGIFLFQRYFRMGYGRYAISEMKRRHSGPITAEINAENYISMEFFKSVGFIPKKVTYAHS